ncbi:MAG: hypothetical protein WD080_13080 [Egibacteraceae bacterium]
MSVDAVEVGAAPATLGSDVGLLVVGGPTHAFGLSRATTRADAMVKATRPLISRGIGIREWMAAVGAASPGVAAAAFDTRIDKPRVPGSAARGAAKRLRHLGFRLACPAASYFVTDTAGPLVPGEVERARDWGEKLALDLALAKPAP